MHNKNNDTKSFTKLGKCILSGYFFLKVLPRAVFRTKPMVELFCKNGQQILAVNFFLRKVPS